MLISTFPHAETHPWHDGSSPRFTPFRPVSELYLKYVEVVDQLELFCNRLSFWFDMCDLTDAHACLAKLMVLYEVMDLEDTVRVESSSLPNGVVLEMISETSMIFGATPAEQQREAAKLQFYIHAPVEEATCSLH